MRHVVDTNVVAAAILRSGLSRRLLCGTGLTLYSPAYLREELQEHKAEFILKSGLSEEAFNKASGLVLTNVHVAEEKEYARWKERAVKISPDADDWPFLALAMEKGCAIWSNDKRLKRQKEIVVRDTTELAKMIGAGDER